MKKEPSKPSNTREERLAREIETQRAIWREGTPETALRRAALTALMERGEW